VGLPERDWRYFDPFLMSSRQQQKAQNQATIGRRSTMKQTRFLLVPLMLSRLPMAEYVGKAPLIIDTGCQWTRTILAHPLDTDETKR